MRNFEILKRTAFLNVCIFTAGFMSAETPDGADAAPKSRAAKLLRFAADDGSPNSRLPLVLYENAVPESDDDRTESIEKLFKSNGWIPMWRWQIYTYEHFHPNTHECIGCALGSAILELGGKGGKRVEISAGDVAVIPAGVSHRQIAASPDFLLVGAYPPNFLPSVALPSPQLLSENTEAVRKVPLPKTDPITGSEGGILKFWK